MGTTCCHDLDTATMPWTETLQMAPSLSLFTSINFSFTSNILPCKGAAAKPEKAVLQGSDLLARVSMHMWKDAGENASPLSSTLALFYFLSPVVCSIKILLTARKMPSSLHLQAQQWPLSPPGPGKVIPHQTHSRLCLPQSPAFNWRLLHRLLTAVMPNISCESPTFPEAESHRGQGQQWKMCFQVFPKMDPSQHHYSFVGLGWALISSGPGQWTTFHPQDHIPSKQVVAQTNWTMSMLISLGCSPPPMQSPYTSSQPPFPDPQAVLC